MASALEEEDHEEDISFDVAAEEEFIKNTDLKKCDIESLREWLKTQLHLPEISDKMLILFHHSQEYDLPKTMNIIENYYTMRTNTPEFFTNRDLSRPNLVQAVEVLNVVPLPIPDPNGFRITYYGLRHTDPEKFVLADVVKLMFMTIDAILMKYGTGPGFHAIYDMKGAKLKHFTRMGLSVLKNFIQFGEKALPIRREIVHMVNVSSWVDKLMLLVKPWLSKESAQNIHYHSSDMETLYTHIPKECLPKELGGHLESVDEFHAANCRTLESLREYFTEEEKLRVDESKRAKKNK